MKTKPTAPKPNPVTRVLPKLLDMEADRYKRLAADTALSALHKSKDSRIISDLDARMIRDHEIRAETFRTCARLAAGN